MEEVRSQEPEVRIARPLVPRCQCGRRISGNKIRCLACQNEFRLAFLATQITGQEMLDAVLQGCRPMTREAVYAKLLPNLGFTPNQEIEVTDCACGLRNGWVIEHGCEGVAVCQR